MVPFYILSIYLLGRLILLPTHELYNTLKFNGIVGLFLLIQYFFHSLYGYFLTFMSTYAVYLLLSGTQSSIYCAYLLLSLSHAVFHDEFMIRENILLNVTVDDLLHGIMFLLVADTFQNRKISKTLSVIGVLNVLVAFLSLDLKYTHKCDEWIFGLSPNQPLTVGCAYWFGGYGGVSTVVMAVAAISGVICLQDHTLTPEILFLEMLPYFFATTAMYFVTDPIWVTELYDRIKYDQIYFIFPIFYHLLIRNIPVLPVLSTPITTTTVKSQITKQVQVASDSRVLVNLI